MNEQFFSGICSQSYAKTEESTVSGLQMGWEVDHGGGRLFFMNCDGCRESILNRDSDNKKTREVRAMVPGVEG